jgi:hypothetical protein
MTWAQFKAKVLILLTVDSNRMGMSDFIALQTKLAAIDLQQHIEYFRQGHVTRYSLSGEEVVGDTEAVTAVGAASQGVLPVDAQIQDAYYIEGTEDFDCPDGVGACADANNLNARKPIMPYPWDNRYDLVAGLVPIVDGHYYMAISPRGGNFIVYPKVEATDLLEIYWDGVNADFDDSDELPKYSDKVAEAVALWVKAEIAREVDDNHAKYHLLMKDPAPGASSYFNKRLFLYLNSRKAAQIRNTTGSRFLMPSQRMITDDTAPSGVVAGDSTSPIPSNAISTGNFIGNGSPEGVVTAAPGARYYDRVSMLQYVKLTGTGNTGWSG